MGVRQPVRNRKIIPAFSAFLYRCRNLVERFFNKLKHFRAVATRYDKRDGQFPRLRPTRLNQDMVAPQ